MTQYAFFFNQKRCLGCKTCVIACKEWNESKRGDANLNRALTEETAGGSVSNFVSALNS